MSSSRQWDRYRLVFTRDGAGWRATAEGAGLPGDGRYIRDKTIARLDARTDELFGDLPEHTCWYLDYSSGPASLHDWAMTEQDLSPRTHKHAGNGHALAQALFTDGATIRDIATATHTSYLCAAWMLAIQPPGTRLLATTRTIQADRRRYYRSSLAGLLQVLAADGIRELAGLRWSS